MLSMTFDMKRKIQGTIQGIYFSQRENVCVREGVGMGGREGE
jgi:hypothetical protein